MSIYFNVQLLQLTAHFGGRVGGHTAQHSPSGITAPEQLTKGQSTALRKDKRIIIKSK